MIVYLTESKRSNNLRTIYLYQINIYLYHNYYSKQPKKQDENRQATKVYEFDSTHKRLIKQKEHRCYKKKKKKTERA